MIQIERTSDEYGGGVNNVPIVQSIPSINQKRQSLAQHRYIRTYIGYGELGLLRSHDDDVRGKGVSSLFYDR